ncbi:MAG: ABC transporter substrate-binding protein [Treponema sp.]|nr:ABC transporter substrate-binding protein [Treponema sp.]
MIKNSCKKALLVGFVAMLVLTPSFAAKKKKGADTYKSVEKVKDPATKKVYDFKEMQIVLGDWWSDPNQAPSSKQQEDQKSFRQWIQDTYNVNIVQKAFASWATQPQAVVNACMTGSDSDAEKYVFCIDGRSANVGIKAGLFYDLSKVTSVDYHNADIYDQSVVKLLEKGKSFYAFNFGVPEPREGMFFNKKLLAEAGYDPDYPYDLQKEGKWTWAAFEEMCKTLTRDTDNDGVIDQYAMSNFYTCFTAAALDSNGASKIGRDANGKFFNNAGSDKAMEAFNWIQYMFQTYQLPQEEGAAWDYFFQAFVNGETAFMCHQEYNAQPGGSLSGMADDWGFVCFPLGPSGDGVYRTIHDTPMWVIPSCYSDETVNKIAKAVELYNQKVPGYDGPDAWKESYYAGFRDSRAVDETITLMSKNPNPRFDKLVSGISEEDMCNSICWGWQTPAEAYESCKNVWDGLLADMNR